MTDQPEPTGCMPARLSVVTRRITFDYMNWRGKLEARTVAPTDVWFGSTEWHPEPQWFMNAVDIEKNVMRDFAMRDMKEVRYAE